MISWRLCLPDCVVSSQCRSTGVFSFFSFSLVSGPWLWVNLCSIFRNGESGSNCLPSLTKPRTLGTRFVGKDRISFHFDMGVCMGGWGCTQSSKKNLVQFCFKAWISIQHCVLLMKCVEHLCPEQKSISFSKSAFFKFDALWFQSHLFATRRLSCILGSGSTQEMLWTCFR